MLKHGERRWRRRKAERPAEIIAAALDLFAEKGFAAAKLDEIAARAGVSKAALYLYFETKEELLQAVLREGVSSKLARMRTFVEDFDGPFAEMARALLPLTAGMMAQAGAGRLIKLVIAESGNFPELVHAWRDEVVEPTLDALAGAVERAQARGEVRPGPAHDYALVLASPLVIDLIRREALGIEGDPGAEESARRQLEAALAGLLTAPNPAG